MGVQADAVAADLYDLTQLDALIERSEAALGAGRARQQRRRRERGGVRALHTR